MPKSERVPALDGYYAVAKQPRGRVIVTLAALSAVLATAGFLALATLTGFVRWSSEEPAVAARSPLPPEAAPPPPGEPKAIWRQEFEDETAALEMKLLDLDQELEEARARAERYRQELDDLGNASDSREER